MEIVVVCFLTFGTPAGLFGFNVVHENVITSSDATCKQEARKRAGSSFSRFYDKNDKADRLKLQVTCGVDERDCRKVN